MQRAFAWSGVVFAVALFISFWGIAGFVPPPSPNNTAAHTAEFFESNAFRIRLGLFLTMAPSALYGSWSVVISAQMRRIEGRYPVLAWFQMLMGALLVLEIIFPVMIWLAAAYRPTDDPMITQRLNDLAWLLFIGVISTGIMQALVIGVAVLGDRRAEPVFPRWLGYLSLWVSLLFAPGGLIVFFKSGPFSWQGIFGFWSPFVGFAVWILAICWVLLRHSIPQYEAEEEAGRADVEALASTGRIG